MLRLLSASQIKALDAHTIARESIHSIDLMERACEAFTHWFEQYTDAHHHTVGIVCGTGNNGGDGLGIARLLHHRHYNIQVWIIRGGSVSPDFTMNLASLPPGVRLTEVNSTIAADAFTGCDIIIDALFGSGLSRPAAGIFESSINAINQSSAKRISVDIPSGLMIDQQAAGPVVKADHTVSFQLPKLAFLLPQNNQYVGDWTLVDIGLDKYFIEGQSTSNFYLQADDIQRIIKPRSKFDHKGTYGHALLVAGSYGKIGAAVLCSRAALRAGVGLLSIHVPACGYTILQSSVPEAMALADVHDRMMTGVESLEPYNVLGIGPGLGHEKDTVRGFRILLEKFRKPFVIDADGLNMLAANRELLLLVPPRSILTPHPKEFERLVGKWKNDFERLDKQRTLSQQLKSVIVLKGANTSIASPEGHCYFNSTGNPGMATGGTGDVLTGILTALLAQGYTSLDAALAGVYIHGLSGDIAAGTKGMISLTASDVIDYLPNAFMNLSPKSPDRA